MGTERVSRHHLIVVADVEGFGDLRRTEPHQRAVREGLYDVVRAAFGAAGVEWGECYHEDRGDAVFVLVPAGAEKQVFVETALPTLVARLRVHNDSRPQAQQIRLRMALHAGEVGYDSHGVTSRSLTLAFRLCDAPQLKAALAASPGVLAVIASDWLFDDVVRHIPAAAPTAWRPVTVAVKETITTGWITLPDHPYRPEPLPVSAGEGVPSSSYLRAGQPEAVPRQLPAAVHDFTGRAEHLAALDALIPPDPGQDGQGDSRVRSVVITAVDGAGGIGKTTLALYWAHRAQNKFPDGTLHVNLRGYGPGVPVTPAEALGGFLRALGVAPRAIPADVETQAAMLRSHLAGKRVLMVLDNASGAEQIRPLLPGTPGCMVVVTSRDSLTGLVVTDAAHRLTLDLLTLPEAHELVAGILGSDRVDAEPVAVAELIRLCARLPLALRIAASRAAARPRPAVADVVAELADDRIRLDILSEAGDERAAVRAVFDWSYQQLPVAQARVFRCLGLHPGPDLSLPAAAALADLSPAGTRPLLAGLEGAHLIELTAGGRYRFHDLLRAYAADQARRHDTAEQRDQAMESLLTWYTHATRTADHHLYTVFAQVPARVAEPAFPHVFAGPDEAWAWLTAERANIQAVLRHATEHGLDYHTIPLTYACRFLNSAGSRQEQLEVYSLGVIAACRTGNATQQAMLLLARGESASRLGRWTQARGDLDRAQALIERLDNVTLRVFALNAESVLLLRQRQFERALVHLDTALPLSRGIDSGRWEAVVEGNLSEANFGLGRYQRSLEHGERGLRLRRQAQDLSGEAGALTLLARTWHALHDTRKAIELCQQAIAIGRRTLIIRYETLAEPLDVLAICQHHLGHTIDAIKCWQEAATIYDDSGHARKAAEVRQRLHQAQAAL